MKQGNDFMTDMLDLTDESVVLEIGTGSGYQAAILSRLAKQVYSIEKISELYQIASRRLKELGYDVYLENQKGFVAPANTPQERIALMNDAFKKTYDHAAFRKLADKLKLELGYMGPDEFKKSLQDMYKQIGEVLKSSG